MRAPKRKPKGLDGRWRESGRICSCAGCPINLEWHLRRALAPLLFDDEDPHAHRARRHPVLPVEVSESGKRRKTKRRTDDGLPIQSFATLMAEMATCARHECRAASDPDDPRLQRLTAPTPLQRRALELVATFPVETKAGS